jgi:hypothetical protein
MVLANPTYDSSCVVYVSLNFAQCQYVTLYSVTLLHFTVSLCYTLQCHSVTIYILTVKHGVLDTQLVISLHEKSVGDVRSEGGRLTLESDAQFLISLVLLMRVACGASVTISLRDQPHTHTNTHAHTHTHTYTHTHSIG